MPANIINAKKFWKAKAANYPLPFDKTTFSKTKSLLKKIKKENIVFKNKTILDIGCGTGVYSLPLAMEGEKVIAVDFSDKMLGILKQETLKKRIENIKIINSEWKNFDAKKYGKKFDIAFASMTAAIRNFSDIKKMETAAKDHCIVVTWAGVRKSRFAQTIYKKFGIKNKAPNFAENIEKYLIKKKREYIKFPANETWEFTGNAKESAKNILPHLQINGIKISLKNLEKTIKEIYHSPAKNSARKKTSTDGLIKNKTYAKKAVFIWKP